MLDAAIEDVFSLVGTMFDHVDEQLADTVNALFTQDTQLAWRVRTADRTIDALELEIDQACETILEDKHPEGAHLRRVIAAMRINADLERIGDLSKNVAKRVGLLHTSRLWQSETQILDMADTVRVIVRQARNAFVECDRLKARQVLALDRRIDRAYRDIVDIIIGLCQAHPQEAPALVHLVALSKAMERIADHAKSIARSVVYYIEGVDIRHPRRGPQTMTSELTS